MLFRSVLGLERRIVAPDGRHRTGLHRGHGLAAGKDDGGGLGLHGGPQLLLRELPQGAALPGAVVALGELVINRRVRGAGLAVEDELRRLPERSSGLDTTPTRGTTASRSPVAVA